MASATRPYLPEHCNRIATDWARELAEKLGRPAAEIVARGLNAGDFRHGTVNVVFEDGSSAAFRYAFFVASKEMRAIAIFTEHCGYFVVAEATVVSHEADTDGGGDY